MPGMRGIIRRPITGFEAEVVMVIKNGVAMHSVLCVYGETLLSVFGWGSTRRASTPGVQPLAARIASRDETSLIMKAPT